MLVRIDPRELRDLGWRKERNGCSFPKRPKKFVLNMTLKSHRIRGITLADGHGGTAQEIYTPSRGFRRNLAKKTLDSKSFKEVLHALEQLHDLYKITL